MAKKTKIKPPPGWEDTPQSFERFERLVRGLMTVAKKKGDVETGKGERSKTVLKKPRKPTHKKI